MISHAPCSSESKPLEILTRAVVTIVVSRAEMKRQNHSPAMMVCSLAGLIFGTGDDISDGTSDSTLVGSFVGSLDIVEVNDIKLPCNVLICTSFRSKWIKVYATKEELTT